MGDFSELFGIESVAREGYINYHKHSGSSSIKQPDSFVNMTDYIKRAKELGHTTISCVEHGSAGDFMKVWKQTKEAGLKFLFGVEIYFKYDLSHSKGSHLVLIAKNADGMRSINKIQSQVIKNRDGFWGLGDLIKLNKENVSITTACLASPLKGQYGAIIFNELYAHFQESLYLEVQPHNDEIQKEWNKHLVELSQKYGLKLVAGIDSHYIYPEQQKLRTIVLKTKGISYGDEDGLLLDYPDREEIFRRFKEQGVLSDYEINEALNNTYDFEETSGVFFDDNIKIPYKYKDKENMKKDFLEICNNEFQGLVTGKTSESVMGYAQEIQREINVFSEGDMISYPLLCHQIVKLGEGNPVTIEGKTYTLDCEPSLSTKTGRGSGGSPLLHNLLGLTTLDRLDSEVPLLFERFISLDRLKAKTLPDLDINVASQEAFERACKILLGEENAYWMYKEETLQIKASIKLVAKYYEYGIEAAEGMIEKYEEYEERAENIQKNRVRELIRNGFSEEEASVIAKSERLKIWEGLELEKSIEEIYKNSEGLIDAIIGVSRHPCGLCLYDGDIEATFGLIRMKDGSICASCTGETLDTFKFLKLDILKVETWDLIFDTFKEVGMTVPDVKEISKIYYSDEIYPNALEIMRRGLTTTLCQFSTANGKANIMRYIPKTIGEISDLSAVMRPACASIKDIFLDRKPFQYGIPALDVFLSKTTGCNLPMMIYQEAIMGVLQLTNDIDLAEAYVVLKAISKKKKKVIMSYKERFLNGFSKYLMSTDRTLEKSTAISTSDKVWEIIESSAQYAFNSSHALAYAYDFVYGCVAKASFNHPDPIMRKLCISYFRKALEINSGDKDTTNELLEELPFFGITIENPSFRNCGNKYTINYSTNTIYRSLSSIYGMGEVASKGLVDLLNGQSFSSFIELLSIIKDRSGEIKLNKAHIKTLILIDFFRDFAGISKLLKLHHAFYEDKKTAYISVSKIPERKIARLQERKENLLLMEEELENEDISLLHKIKFQLEFLGVSYLKIPEKKDLYIVTAVDGEWNRTITAYNVEKGQFEIFKYRKSLALARPLNPMDVVMPLQIEHKPKSVVVHIDEEGNKVWGKSKDIKEKWLLKFHRKTIEL